MIVVEPLVSVVVISYNSSKYIIETLNSIYAQTYQRIELIVSDDSSTDETVELCEQWLELNRWRFINVIIEKSKINTGITKNLNRGIKRASGDWVKIIAGDDILLKACIDSNINYTKTNTNKFIFSKMDLMFNGDSLNKKKWINQDNYYLNFYGNQLKNFENNGYYFTTPSFFASRNELETVGFFDERFPFNEDFPMWLKLLRLGYVFGFINEVTCVYRINENSITNLKGRVISPYLFSSVRLFYEKELIPFYRTRGKYLMALHCLLYIKYYNTVIFFGNKRNIIYYILKPIYFLSPQLIIWVYKGLFNRLNSFRWQ